MGKAAAFAIIESSSSSSDANNNSQAGHVLLASRNREKLQRAQKELIEAFPSSHVDICVLDARDESQVEAFAQTLDAADDHWDYLVVSSAGRAPHGPMTELETAQTRDMMESKVWTAYHCAKYIAPKLRDGGAVCFVAGILNRRPGLNCCPLAIANGALEGMTRTLALEWGPRLRVNCLSPGFCDTERFDHMDPDRKAKMMANTAASLPLQKVGKPQDMGRAIFYLLTAPFCTGVILDVDGGHGIRQYASPVNDPMRTKNQ